MTGTATEAPDLDRTSETAARPLQTWVDSYTTDLARVAGDELAVDAAEALERAGVGNGQRFVLGPDGSYDQDLNRFIRDLPSWGVRSQNGISAYCSDLVILCRFLHEARGGKTIWQINGQDLHAFKKARLYAENPRLRVTEVTWTRSLAAVDKWVAWSLYEGLLPAEPFRYIEKTVLTPSGPARIRVNAEAEPLKSQKPITFLPYEDYLQWRDVGLLGYLPDGEPDPTWRGRNGERNALFADLLISTGMRLGENASLLVPEIPPLSARGGIHLSPAVTKGQKGRVVIPRQNVLRQLHHYLAIERDELVQRRRAEGAYEDLHGRRLVKGATQCGAITDGKPLAYARLNSADRELLVSMDAAGRPAGPLWLWLGEDGLPLSKTTWQSAFRRANRRCAQFGIDFDVHPHTLRHTYAVHMLGLLLRQAIRKMGNREDRRYTLAQIKSMLIGNPMRKLQLLLGHAREETVYIYLDVLDEAQEIVLAALDDWDEQAAALDRRELPRAAI